MMRFLAALLLLPVVAFAAQAPDTPLVTGPGFQQIPSGNVLVTPTGGMQQKLSDALSPAGINLNGANASGANVTATGGSAARSTAAIASDAVNVMSYVGIDPTGAADSSAPINAAATYACTFTPPKEVYFPGGTYAVSAPVSAPCSGLVFRAAPGSVTIKPTTGSVANPVLLAVTSLSNVTISGLTLDGGGQDFGTANNVVQVYNSAGVIFEKMTFQNTRGIGLLLSQSNTSGVRNSTFSNVGNHWKTTGVSTDRQQAISFCCGTASANVGNFVQDNFLTNIGLDAISVSTTTDTIITGNRCEMANNQVALLPTSAYAACVYFSNNIGGIISHNATNGASGNGIDTIGSSNVTLTGNYAANSGQAGIGIFGITTGSISGNTLINNGQWTSSAYRGGITISGATAGLTIAGNVATDTQGSKTQTYGLQVVSGSTFTGDFRVDPSNSFAGNLTSPIGGILVGYGVGGTSDNRVRNPCGAIDQVKEGGAYAAGGGNTNTLDGFITTQTTGGIAVARGSFAPPGCTTSLHVSLTNTRTAGSTDFYQIEQNIEGVDFQDLNWGTVNAKPVVVDFCAKPSVSGTFSFVLRNNNGPRYYATTYAATAGTQTCQSLVIPGDVVTPIVNNTSAQIELIWDFGSGSSNLTSTTGAWTAGGPAGVAGETLFVGGTPGDTFDISAIRLYAGQADVPWIPRSMADELAKVRRYYQKSFSVGIAVAQNAGATGSIGFTAPYAQATFGTVSMPLAFPPMRAAPVVVFYSPSAASANCYDTTKAADAGAGAATNIGTNSLTATCTLAATDALGDLLNVHFTLDSRI